MIPLIVTAAVIRDGDAILITRRPQESRHGGMWEFPGGKLDAGESPQECLSREILEELGLEVAVESIFEIAYHRYEWGPVLILAFECRVLNGEIRHIGISDHRWVSPEEMRLYDILPADRPIIAKLLKSV
ncbi:(deoxy)nucleoside triphosphate pyrophosphohydrolase [Desulfuromonas sp. TF]|uniref:(deoxy)nucleoside triphosphate pyrophosphohydrolase n=1 Tax=Desulfuromonas sp. TF TaxID=1232410 RepID=UPI00041BD7E5|nr:(deoxy)nucleoside triphosphate pyrophosphohydrolase [Desulfuromonas sp. TF]